MATYIRWSTSSARTTHPLRWQGANLGEMTRAGLPVPPGFVVAAEAYRAFVSTPASVISSSARSPPRMSTTAARSPPPLTLSSPHPRRRDSVRRLAAVADAYRELTVARARPLLVAVRSSALWRTPPKPPSRA